jgi:hypothetical protein
VDFSRLMDGFGSFAQNHTIIVIVLVLGFLFFIYRKPKVFFSILFLGLFLAGLFYMITTVGGLGTEQKKRLIHEEEKQYDSNR